MLNLLAILLNTPVKERAECLTSFSLKMRNDLIKAIPTLTDILKLNEVKDYEERVRLRYEYITANPDKIFWDYPELWTRNNEHFTSKSILVSTRGDGVRWDENRNNYIQISSATYPGTDQYRRLDIKGNYVKLSRVIACTYLPKPKELAYYDFSNLKVSGDEKNRANSGLSSIQWGEQKDSKSNPIVVPKEVLLDKINYLLTLDKKERVEEKKKLTRKGLFDPFKCIVTLTDILDLDRISDYNERIRLKYEYILQHPNERHWDYAEYHHAYVEQYETKRTMLVSTYGDVINTGVDGRISISASADSKGSLYHSVTFNTEACLVTHRIIASTFIPRTDKFISIPFYKLEVNHKDKNGLNNNVFNLEWLTGVENTLHRRGNRDYIEDVYLQFEIMGTKRFKGRKFIVPSADTNSELLSNRNLRNKKSFMGMKITRISKDDIGEREIGIPDDIADALKNDRASFKIRARLPK